MEPPKLAELLLSMAERELHRSLGYESVFTYARRVLGFSKRKTRDTLEIAKRLPELPVIAERFRAGDLRWTALRTILPAVKRENEHEWLEKVSALPVHVLEREVAKATGEPMKVRVTYEFTEEQNAWVEDAVTAVLKERKGSADVAAALAEVCRRALAGGTVGGPRTRVGAPPSRPKGGRGGRHVCAECEKATRETREGPVEVSKPALEEAACDAELLDIREGPSAICRTMPPKVARFIDARDHGRCVVPGCGNRGFVARHHEGGWREVGHDPARAYVICFQHHTDRHLGRLLVELAGGAAAFRLADGSPLGAPVALVSCPRGPREPTPEGDALAALKKLEFTTTEAKKLVRAALAKPRGTPWTAEELLREALLLSG